MNYTTPSPTNEELRTMADEAQHAADHLSTQYPTSAADQLERHRERLGKTAVAFRELVLARVAFQRFATRVLGARGGQPPRQYLRHPMSTDEAHMHAAFQVHMLTEDGQRKARAIAQAFDDLLSLLVAEGVPEGREMALVRTKLEEACFFAKKAMAQKNAEQG
jgi:hypothetical protein